MVVSSGWTQASDALTCTGSLVDGTVAWSIDKNPVGKLIVKSGDTQETVGAKNEHEGLASRTTKFVESYIPIRDPQSNRVVGAMELYKTPARLARA